MMQTNRPVRFSAYLEIVPIRTQFSLVHAPELRQVGVFWTEDAVVHPHVVASIWVGAPVIVPLSFGRVGGTQLFDSVRVAKCVQSVLAGAHHGRNHGNLG